MSSGTDPLPAGAAAATPVLPVLDLRKFRDPATRVAFVDSLRAALADWGFFYLTGQ